MNKKQKTQSEDEEVYVLAPKGIFEMSVIDAGLAEDYQERRLEVAWELFQSRMRESGYLREE